MCASIATVSLTLSIEQLSQDDRVELYLWPPPV